MRSLTSGDHALLALTPERQQLLNLPIVCFVQPTSYRAFFPSVAHVQGGAEFQVRSLSSALAAEGRFDVRCVVGDYGQAGQVRIDGVLLHRTMRSDTEQARAAKVRRAVSLFALLWRIRPDVIVTTTKTATIAVAVLYSFLCKTPHIHRIAHDSEVGNRLPKSPATLWHRVFRVLLSATDAVMFQTKAQAARLAPRKKQHRQVVPSIAAWSVGPLPRRRREYVLWVGRTVDFKQPRKLLDLARATPEIPYVMICAPGSNREAHETLRTEASAVDNLKFVPGVSPDSVMAYFQKAAVLVNTSAAEGFPNTFLQAGVAGTPVVSLGVDPDVFIQQYDCGITCSHDSTRMTAAVRDLWNGPEDWERKRRNISEYVQKYHSPAAAVEAFESVLVSVLKIRPRRRTVFGEQS